MLSRVARPQTVQRTLRECRKYTSKAYKQHSQPFHRPFVGGLSRQMSTATSGASDSMLIVAGAGILGATCLFTYYATNTQFRPEKPEQPAKNNQVVAHATLQTEVTEKEFAERAANVKLPESAPYVIIGAGTSAHAACRAIRKNDPNAKVLMIGEENALPYMRPPLSKELWFTDSDVSKTLVFKSWNGKERSVFFEDTEYYMNLDEFESAENGGVAVVTGLKVSSINAEGQELTLTGGKSVKYGKLLIASGGTPKNHRAFADAGEDVMKRTTLFRNIADFQRLHKAVGDSKEVVVVGGGFLGTELACALAARGKTNGLKVTQIYPEEGNMAKVLPKYLSKWTTSKISTEGVEVLSKSSVTKVQCADGKLNLQLENGETTTADHVVVCVGLKANVELAASAGLEVDPQEGGFRVNSELEARSDIWVAGDAACFYDIRLGRRRVEHHDHAVVSGRLAGENMTGAKRSYHHQSMFWSDLGPDVGYEAIGLVDSSLPTVGVWAKATESDTPKGAEEASGEIIRSESETAAVGESTVSDGKESTTDSSEVNESFGKGIVFYMKEKKVVGILLWNIFSQMPVARKIISEGKDHEDLNALAKLFKIY